MGSFCISTIRITLCLAPELKATPCWDGVYLQERSVSLGMISTYINKQIGSCLIFLHSAVLDLRKIRIEALITQ